MDSPARFQPNCLSPSAKHPRRSRTEEADGGGGGFWNRGNGEALERRQICYRTITATYCDNERLGLTNRTASTDCGIEAAQRCLPGANNKSGFRPWFHWDIYRLP
jgi:hypothetical protein